MKGDFNGPPLVAGSLFGYRHFTASGLGLRGPSTGAMFQPGENTAVHVGMYGPTWFTSDASSTIHRVATRNCRCGYYAYFKSTGSPYASFPYNVAAVIEGYGRVVVGNLGFRSEKAKLVAVTLPLRHRDYGNILPPIEHLARMYPDTRFYRNERVMLEEHPLSDPMEVETGPDEDTEVKVDWGKMTTTTITFTAAAQGFANTLNQVTTAMAAFPSASVNRGGITYGSGGGGAAQARPEVGKSKVTYDVPATPKVIPPMPAPTQQRRFRWPWQRRT